MALYLFVHSFINSASFISSLKYAGMCPGYWGAMEKLAALADFRMQEGLIRGIGI